MTALGVAERAVAQRDRRRGYGLVAPAALWTLAFFLLPTLTVAGWSFLRKEGSGYAPGLSLDNYARFLEQDYFWKALINSLEITALVTALSLLLAYPLAMMIAFRVPARWQRLCLVAAVLPFWTSYVVRSYAWLLVLAPNGVINQTLLGLGLIETQLALSFNSGATVLGFVHFFTMLATLTIYASLSRINPRLMLAARDLGASGAQTFWRIILPLSMPGVASAAFLIIVIVMGDYVTPQILGGNTELVLPQTIMMQIQRRADVPMAAALSMIMMVVVALAYLALARRMTARPT
jgi:spermidine/putrescine transport system permease protein